jgi:hypothetical protein
MLLIFYIPVMESGNCYLTEKEAMTLASALKEVLGINNNCVKCDVLLGNIIDFMSKKGICLDDRVANILQSLSFSELVCIYGLFGVCKPCTTCKELAKKLNNEMGKIWKSKIKPKKCEFPRNEEEALILTSTLYEWTPCRYQLCDEPKVPVPEKIPEHSGVKPVTSPGTKCINGNECRKKGNGCLFVHPGELGYDVAREPPKLVCKYGNWCKKKENGCPFYHPTPTYGPPPMYGQPMQPNYGPPPMYGQPMQPNYGPPPMYGQPVQPNYGPPPMHGEPIYTPPMYRP